MLDNPVTLPPGRARLMTSPAPTGSAAETKTMDRLGRLLGGQGMGLATCHDDVNLERD